VSITIKTRDIMSVLLPLKIAHDGKSGNGSPDTVTAIEKPKTLSLGDLSVTYPLRTGGFFIGG